MEDNIEGGSITASMGSSAGGLQDTLVTLLGQRASLDLEELAILGDTATVGDDYLAMTDGFLKLAVAHVVDAQNATLTKDVFKASIMAMPDVDPLCA